MSDHPISSFKQPPLPPVQSPAMQPLVTSLLALRQESLMKAVGQAAARDPDARLDYGNASAWLRGIPGRLGSKKLLVLLDYLGIHQGRLNAERIHWWYLPKGQVLSEQNELLMLLRQYAGEPSAVLWLQNTAGNLLGLAIKAGAVSVVLQLDTNHSQADLNAWLSLLPKTFHSIEKENGIKSEATWAALKDGNAPPSALWEKEASFDDQVWQEVIGRLKKRGLNAQAAGLLIDTALSLMKEDETIEMFRQRVLA